MNQGPRTRSFYWIAQFTLFIWRMRGARSRSHNSAHREEKANKRLQRPNERQSVIYSCLRCSIIIVFMCHRSFPFSCGSNNNMRTFFSCCVLFFLFRSLLSLHTNYIYSYIRQWVFFCRVVQTDRDYSLHFVCNNYFVSFNRKCARVMSMCVLYTHTQWIRQRSVYIWFGLDIICEIQVSWAKKARQKIHDTKATIKLMTMIHNNVNRLWARFTHTLAPTTMSYDVCTVHWCTHNEHPQKNPLRLIFFSEEIEKDKNSKTNTKKTKYMSNV